jgi:RNA polymerase sigma-70 factor (ECF subfamily)
VGEGYNTREWLQWERSMVGRAQQGDRPAFAELYRAFANPLFSRVLWPRLGNRQAAEDALAETFRTVLERIDRFQYDTGSIWSWLVRIALNKATDMYRVKSRTARALANFEGLVGALQPPSQSPSSGAEEAEALAQLGGNIERVLHLLNPRYRRAIELRFMQDRPRAECAEVLEVKLATFDVLLLRALRAFRREWEALLGVSEEAPAR